MRLSCVLILCSLAIGPAFAETNAPPAEITVDGVTYEGVRWGTVTPVTVSIFHKTGVATISLEKLPPELQKQLGYDPQKAAAWQQAEERRALIEKFSSTPLTQPLTVGMIGISRKNKIKVIQVVGPNEMRAQVYIAGVHSSQTKKQVSVPAEVWVKGISTEGLVDGVEIACKEVFQVTGTTTGTTTHSGMPFFVLEPLASLQSD